MIIVSGASGGLGALILVKLSNIDKVCALYNKNKPSINPSKNIKLIKIDLSSEEEIINFSDTIAEKKISIIHLAAVYKEKILINLSAEEYDEHYMINQKAIFLLNKYVIKKMLKHRWGRIISISSPAAEKGHVGTFAYSSTKSSLIGMSRVISNEYAKYNITSNIVILGYFNTGIYKKLGEATKIKLINSIPSKKLGDINSIINAIKFIIESEFVNGSIINVDGGV